MALIREREPNPVEAEALYRSALAAEDPNSAESLSTAQLFARFLMSQGRGDEAKAIRDQIPTSTTQPRPQSSGVLRVGGGVMAPSVLSKVDPEFTEEARVAKYSGTSVLTVEISPDGTAQNIQIVKALGLGLDEKAMEAIGKWRFKPGTKDGVPVTVAANIEVNFRLL
jgi:TonB family protein